MILENLIWEQQLEQSSEGRKNTPDNKRNPPTITKTKPKQNNQEEA